MPESRHVAATRPAGSPPGSVSKLGDEAMRSRYRGLLRLSWDQHPDSAAKRGTASPASALPTSRDSGLGGGYGFR